MDIAVIHKGMMISAPKNRWSKLRTRITLAVLGTGAVIGAMIVASPPEAKADGVLTQFEKNWGDDTWPVTCNELDESGVTKRTVVILAKAIENTTGLSLDNAGDVLKYQINTYCPEHWGPLQNLIAADSIKSRKV